MASNEISPINNVNASWFWTQYCGHVNVAFT